MVQLIGTHNPQLVVSAARSWLGTPYKHQYHVKGVDGGCDCIGLILGVWEDIFEGRVPKDFVLPPYTPFWAEYTKTSPMVDVGNKYLVPIPVEDKQPGDVLMWQMFRGGPTKHASIMSGLNRHVHAYAGFNVTEGSLIRNMGSTLTHVFRYPADWSED